MGCGGYRLVQQVVADVPRDRHGQRQRVEIHGASIAIGVRPGSDPEYGSTQRTQEVQMSAEFGPPFLTRRAFRVRYSQIDDADRLNGLHAPSPGSDPVLTPF